MEYCRNPGHVSPKWPDEYWPSCDAPPDVEAWDRTLQAFRKDRADLEALVNDPANDLVKPFTWGEGHTLLREVLLAADHTAYHLGQLLVVRRLLGAWNDK